MKTPDQSGETRTSADVIRVQFPPTKADLLPWEFLRKVAAEWEAGNDRATEIVILARGGSSKGFMEVRISSEETDVVGLCERVKFMILTEEFPGT